MRNFMIGLLVFGVVSSGISIADDGTDDAVKKDRQLIEGTWQVTALEINGTKSNDEDVKKLTVVNGSDGTWSVRSEGNTVSAGTSTIDPTAKPKTIDFTATEGGGTGDQFIGIYQLRKNKRKLCFVRADKKRPTKFTSTAEDGQILVTFARIKK